MDWAQDVYQSLYDLVSCHLIVSTIREHYLGIGWDQVKTKGDSIPLLDSQQYIDGK